MSVVNVGAVLFGFVVGWITYRTLARTTKSAQISDLATVIGAIGGGVVVSLFDDDRLFGLYAIGLFIGFFAYLIVFFATNGKKATAKILGEGDDTVRVTGD